MNELLPLLLVWLAGIMLGALFYGGLWWTVQKSASSQRPGLLFFASMSLRMALVLVGFYLVCGSHWQRLVLCLLGFIAARIAVTWLTRLPRPESPTSGTKHAP